AIVVGVGQNVGVAVSDVHLGVAADTDHRDARVGGIDSDPSRGGGRGVSGPVVEAVDAVQARTDTGVGVDRDVGGRRAIVDLSDDAVVRSQVARGGGADRASLGNGDRAVLRLGGDAVVDSGAVNRSTRRGGDRDGAE